MRRFAAGAAVLATALLVALAGCGGDGGDADNGETSPEPTPLRLGTKNFTEQYILGEIYAQALRVRGIPVDLKSDVGSSEIIDQAMQLGSLDMYPEYTGVLLSEIAGRSERPASAEETYEAARDFQERRGYALLGMTPFSNSNVLAVTPATAERYGLRTIADLAKIPGGARIAAAPEFRTRYEGLVGLRMRYGLRNARVDAVPIGEQYLALERDSVHAAAVFATDGMLQKGDYVVLRDPRGLFSFQNVAPVVRQSVLDRTPELSRVLDAVSAKLTTAAMREMNAAVDLEDEQPAVVAKAFLQEHDLL
jgi:osmoprotectant transport system substrate-binding protein